MTNDSYASTAVGAASSKRSYDGRERVRESSAEPLIQGLLAATAHVRPTDRPNAILAIAQRAGLEIDHIDPFQSPRAVSLTVTTTANRVDRKDRCQRLDALEEAISAQIELNRTMPEGM